MTKQDAIRHFEESLQMEQVRPGEFHLKEMLGIEGHEDSYDLYLYGGGLMAEIAYKQFAEQEIPVKGVIDRNPDNVKIPARAYSLDAAAALKKERAIVVLTLVLTKPQEAESLIAQLKKLGFSRIYYWVDYVVQRAMFYSGLSDSNVFFNNQEEIRTVLALLDDDKSREVLCGFIRGCITKKFEEHIKFTDANEYDPDRTPATTNWNCMIDAGAYTGDSLDGAMAFRKHLGSYMAFEPDWENFELLHENVKKFQDRVTQAILWPCAVGIGNHTVFFDADGNSNSKVSDKGTAPVPMVRIDDVIQAPSGQEHLLIKMDIEGAELDALDGAANTICTHRPDLMICVYHRISDMWEIPLYLHHLLPEYQFKMRCYTVFGGETILYATCR